MPNPSATVGNYEYTMTGAGPHQKPFDTHLENTMSKTTIKPVAAAVGFALVGSLAVTNLASAAENPFGASQLSHGYLQLAEADKAKAEGKCGGEKMSTEAKMKAEGKCGEGKCGAAGKATEKKGAEGKCGGEKKAPAGKPEAAK